MQAINVVVGQLLSFTLCVSAETVDTVMLVWISRQKYLFHFKFFSWIPNRKNSFPRSAVQKLVLQINKVIVVDYLQSLPKHQLFLKAIFQIDSEVPKENTSGDKILATKNQK